MCTSQNATAMRQFSMASSRAARSSAASTVVRECGDAETWVGEGMGATSKTLTVAAAGEMGKWVG